MSLCPPFPSDEEGPPPGCQGVEKRSRQARGAGPLAAVRVTPPQRPSFVSLTFSLLSWRSPCLLGPGEVHFLRPASSPQRATREGSLHFGPLTEPGGAGKEITGPNLARAPGGPFLEAYLCGERGSGSAGRVICLLHKGQLRAILLGFCRRLRGPVPPPLSPPSQADRTESF